MRRHAVLVAAAVASLAGLFYFGYDPQFNRPARFGNKTSHPTESPSRTKSSGTGTVDSTACDPPVSRERLIEEAWNRIRDLPVPTLSAADIRSGKIFGEYHRLRLPFEMQENELLWRLSIRVLGTQAVQYFQALLNDAGPQVRARGALGLRLCVEMGIDGAYDALLAFSSHYSDFNVVAGLSQRVNLNTLQFFIKERAVNCLVDYYLSPDVDTFIRSETDRCEQVAGEMKKLHNLGEDLKQEMGPEANPSEVAAAESRIEQIMTEYDRLCETLKARGVDPSSPSAFELYRKDLEMLQYKVARLRRDRNSYLEELLRGKDDREARWAAEFVAIHRLKELSGALRALADQKYAELITKIQLANPGLDVDKEFVNRNSVGYDVIILALDALGGPLKPVEEARLKRWGYNLDVEEACQLMSRMLAR